MRHSVKEQILINAECQGANFNHTQCQGAKFFVHSFKEQSLFAQFQGAIFNHAQFQGADFSAAQCQGADFYLHVREYFSQVKEQSFISTMSRSLCSLLY